jgi:integral membrane protein (TIGR01906 family)
LNRLWIKAIYWLVVLLMPLFLVLTSARILVTDWYPRYEYAKPDFPADPYGFTQAQRLDLALACIHYLQRPEPPEQAFVLLAALRLPGTEDPLFDKFELSHMIDVKRLTDVLWRVHLLSGIVVAGGLIALLARRATRREGYAALYAGGLLTAGLTLALVLFVLLSWRTFFITFHDVFFPPGTWTFDWSDSLIRLFPDKFWFDAGTILTVSALVAGLIVAATGYVLKRRAGSGQQMANGE